MADKFSHNMLPDNCKDTLIVMEEKKEKDKEFAECGGLLSQNETPLRKREGVRKN